MQPKVSVIVPVYNAAAYFSHCLETLTHQTLKELEIIVVLDCPTDGSDKIAETYASQYSNIRLIYNEKNLHVSESRNRGIAAATGEYIGFSDADDFQELNMYEKMYKVAKQEAADVVLVDRKTYTSTTPESINPSNPEEVTLTGGYEFTRTNLLKMIRGKFDLYLSWLYTHLYRRDFLKESGLRLVDSRTMMAEDLLFNIQVYHRLLQEQGKLVYLPQAYYNYRVYEGSMCHSAAFYKFAMTCPLLEQICLSLEHSKEFTPEEIREGVGTRIVSNLYSSWCKEVQLSGFFPAFRGLFKCRHNEVIRRNLKRYKKLNNKDLPLKKNVFAVLLRLLMI